MEIVCTFVDNEEDKLPDVFDPSKVVKQNHESCYLCTKTFSKMQTALTGARHHCKKCGQTVCALCCNNTRRLSKLDKKQHEICDKCDMMMANINFESMYITCIEKQQHTLLELKRDLHKKDQKLKIVSNQLDRMRLKFDSRVIELDAKESVQRAEIEQQELIMSQIREENEMMVECLEDCEV